MKERERHALVAVLAVGILLVVAQPFGFSGVGQAGSLNVDRAYWLRLATNAWNYFQPGIAVNSTTGLHSAGLGYPYFTDWDLGMYVQAIIDANRLGILDTSGTWGADARLNKILTFLENRPLTSTGVPYVWYQVSNGNAHGSAVQEPYDAGALLVALNNLRVYRPDLTATINYIVHTRTNYSPLEQQIATFSNLYSLYDYYAASGFAGFWPSNFSALTSKLLSNIMSRSSVSTYGVVLPASCKLACDPLLLSVFNLSPNAQVENLAQQVNLAQQARYTATGKFTAFSEGNTGLDNPSYVYEFVVDWDSSTWDVYNTQFSNASITPIIYFKAAVGMLAMYNIPYTENMASYLESKLPTPSNGYSDGVDENGRLVSTDIDKTNSMIIQAAQYAINGSPSPSPTPTRTPSPTSTPSPVPTHSPTPSPIISPSISPSPSPASTPTQFASPTEDPIANSNAEPAATPHSNEGSTQNSSSASLSSDSTPVSSASLAPDGSGVFSTQTPTELGHNTPQADAETLYFAIGVFFSVFAIGLVFLKKRH